MQKRKIIVEKKRNFLSTYNTVRTFNNERVLFKTYSKYNELVQFIRDVNKETELLGFK